MSDTTTTDAPPARVSATELARRGWASPLAAVAVVGLILLSVGGLWIWLAPFSVVGQVQVLTHTLIGILLLVPLGWYLVSHTRVWWRQTMTAVMMLGYVLLLFVVVSCVSGVILTWEAGFGTRRSPLWDLIHLVSSIGTTVVLAIHVPLAWLRRRPAQRTVPALGMAFTSFVRRTVVGSAVGLVAVFGAGLAISIPAPGFPVPDDYALSEYLQSYDEYRDSPFAPTYARTSTGEMVREDLLADSASCGTTGCHEQIYKEWLPSAHRFSAMNPPFRKVQQDFVDERGVEEARYCAGCHDPISLFSGARAVHTMADDSPGIQEGCSCVVCHSISQADKRGNADYVLTPPKKYLWEGTRGLTKFVSDFLIRAYPQQHLADYDRNILRTPEFCAACHKQFIPEALNRFGLAPGQNQYDEWRNSRWHTDDPDTDLSCRDCHMRLVDSTDPGAGERGDRFRTAEDGKHRHHGTIATNMFMPAVMKLEGWERHVALTEEWIRGETVLPEIDHLWERGPVVKLDCLAPEKVEAGKELSVRLLVGNRKVGHNFSTGPLDFVRAWIHLRVLDADGRTLGEWGNIDPTTRRIQDVPGKEHKIGNPRDEGTMVLESMPVNEKGEPLVRHDLWNMAGGTGLRVIFPGYQDNQKYRLVIPVDAKGPLQVIAALNFRRYRQEFLDLVVPEMEKESGVYQPTVQQTAVTRSVQLTPASTDR